MGELRNVELTTRLYSHLARGVRRLIMQSDSKVVSVNLLSSESKRWELLNKEMLVNNFAFTLIEALTDVFK